jgi:cytochrome c
MTLRRLLAAGTLWVCVTGPALAAPDAVRGEQIYVRCQACHALSYDRVGPRHCGLFGRAAGSVPGFAYSPAMKRSHIVWNDKTLDRFLTSPLKMVPGTAMTYDGVPDAKDRADLLAYLEAADRSPECAALRAAKH